MYAVIRETSYARECPIHETEEFQEFQQAHASLNGYQGTVVVDVGSCRFLTLTLWQSAEDMTAARKAMEPVVERTVNLLMTAPARLIGTGSVVVNDVTQAHKRPA